MKLVHGLVALGVIAAGAVALVALDLSGVSTGLERLGVQPAPVSVAIEQLDGSRTRLTLRPDRRRGITEEGRQLEAVLMRWQDLEQLASSTPRIQLAVVLRDMQAVKREVAEMPLPACVEPGREFLFQMMAHRIDGILSFVGQKTFEQDLNFADADRAARNWAAVKGACS